MRQRTFFFWNILGAIGWALSHVLLGYFSGNIIAIVIKKWSARLGWILFLALIALFLYWLIKKHHQNIWRYYIRTSERFTQKLFSYRLVQRLTGYYPIAGELFQTPISQGKTFGIFLGSIILIILYILVLVLDLI
jgi:undecaprenyl-diphosphatase